jgi:hypothetical protein
MLLLFFWNTWNYKCSYDFWFACVENQNWLHVKETGCFDLYQVYLQDDLGVHYFFFLTIGVHYLFSWQ